MNYKRIPFDIELAKKIQSKEIEGKIINRDGYPARIICFDPIHPTPSLIGLVLFPAEDNTCKFEKIFRYSFKGIVLGNDKNFIHNLYIELPKETKHEFKPFDKVLVRVNLDEVWKPRLYSHKCTDGSYAHYCQDGKSYGEIIPYEGNEHLIGTINNPKEN